MRLDQSVRFFIRIGALSAVCLCVGAQDLPLAGLEIEDSEATKLARRDWFYNQRTFPSARVPAGGSLKRRRPFPLPEVASRISSLHDRARPGH